MEKIPAPSAMENATRLANEAKQKAAKSLLNNAGIFVGAFICFVVVVVLTTDIQFNSFYAIVALGLEFYILMFCSYSMYISSADSGMRAGYRSKIYTDAVARYKELKKRIIEQNFLSYLILKILTVEEPR